jgi:uncharacterized protein
MGFALESASIAPPSFAISWTALLLLVDVNVLVYALREDAPRHIEYSNWLDRLVNGERRFGVSSTVLSGVLRVATHPLVYRTPTPTELVLDFLGEIVNAPGCEQISPGPQHWWIFDQLCRTLKLTGNSVPDAWLAALAIESGCEWVTTDRGFARFVGLKWRHPLDG